MTPLSILWVLAACLGFSLVFNVRGIGIAVSCAGSGLGWLCYLLTGLLGASVIWQTFFAAVVISIYAEGMARLLKCPASAYLLIASLPLLPGSGIYYAAEFAILGQAEQCLETLGQALGVAGAIALGVLLVSTVVRMLSVLWQKRRG